MTVEQSPSSRGFLIGIASAAVLSFTGILIRMVSEDYQLPALVIAFWRDFLVVLCALPALLLIKPERLRLQKEDLGFLLLFGIALSCLNITWTLAVTLSGAAIATVLVYSSAGFTAIFGYLLFHEALGLKKILSVILCLSGCILVSGATDLGAWRENALGIISGIFSGMLYSVYSLMGRKAIQRGLNPWTTVFYAFLFAAVILLIINFLPQNFIPGSASSPSDLVALGRQWRGWLLLLLLAGGPTLIGFGLYNMSLVLLPTSTANLILTLEPVLTAIIAYFLLSERLTAIELVGSGMIILALILLRIGRLTRPSKKHPSKTSPH